MTKLISFLRKNSRKVHKLLGFSPTTSIIAVILVLGAGFVFTGAAKQATIPDYSSFNDDTLDASLLSISDSAFTNDTNPMGEFQPADSEEDFAGFVLVDKNSFLNSSTPGTTKAGQGGLLTYIVSEGDNLSAISSKFGISINTIIWANNLKSSNFLKTGQEIVILPVSGVLHEVKEDETLDSIADLYGISVRNIKTFNKNNLSVGDTVVIPNVKPVKSSSSSSSLPDAGNYLAYPVQDGYNWGRLHMNAVDISAACGTPIYASAEGLVEGVGSPNNYNDGFGGYVKIKHPLNDIETLYAHTSTNLVSSGDYVSRGDLIAKIGNTGKVTGSTGCHVHFGVFGAQHPFVR